jgi:16S rRNA (uracil1498-N3)-methyltransferase
VRIPRIYQPQPLTSGRTIELDAQATAHLTRVLRLKPGDELVLFNGEGGEFAARIEALEKRAAVVRVGEFVAREAESPLELVLVQGVSRGERMDYTVQKAVELGVSRIVPVITERTVVNLKDERRERRQDHWQAVAIGACEQSGRNRVPVIEPVIAFDRWLAAAPAGLKFVLHHRAEQGLSGVARPAGPVTLLIGPEGGLSPAEIDASRAAGFQPLCLGPRVMRTETAAVAALAVLQWLWGDFGLGGNGR